MRMDESAAGAGATTESNRAMRDKVTTRAERAPLGVLAEIGSSGVQ